MPDNLGETLALATAMMALAAAVACWLGFVTRDVADTTGAAVMTGATALLAALAMPFGGWFRLIPLGLALGALGDLSLARTGGAASGLGPVACPIGSGRRRLAGERCFSLP